MAVSKFKLKKDNASMQLVIFQERPSWEDLALQITNLFNVPEEHVGMVYGNDNRDMIHLNNQEDLQRLYRYLGHSSEVAEFVVQDIAALDNNSEHHSLPHLFNSLLDDWFN